MKYLILTLALLACYALSDEVTGIKYINVGGSGSYEQVVDMAPGKPPKCEDPVGSCKRKTKNVSGNLAPFDEDLTLVFRGPMNIYNVQAFRPRDHSPNPDQPWREVALLRDGERNNMVILNNKGDANTSGVFTECGGHSQSYASVDYKSAAQNASPGVYSTHLPAGEEINIMTGEHCGQRCEGFVRGVSHFGWKGPKAFVFEVDMPLEGESSPAIYALNSQIVRSAQYGCNCRGDGQKGGCGSVSLLDVIDKNQPERAVSNIESFKGSAGNSTDAYFKRPDAKSIYAVIFDVKSDSIAIQKLDSFDWYSDLDSKFINDLLNSNGKTVIDFGKGEKIEQ